MNAPLSPFIRRFAGRGHRPSAARLLVCAVLLASASCKVGPNFKPPETKAPESWIGTSGTPNPQQTSLVVPSPITAVDWWTMFNDEKLDKLITEAAAQNLTVLQAQARIFQAAYSVQQTTSNLFPDLNSNLGYSRSGSGGSAPSSNFSAGLSTGWNLDIFGGTRRQIEAAQANYEAAVQDRRDTLITIIAQIGTTYADLRTVQERLRIAHINLTDQEKTLSITQQRFEGGFVSRLDVENATATVESTRAQIPNLETQQRQDIYQLSILLGKDPGYLIAELEPVGPYLRAPDRIPIGLPSELLRRRPDIRAAEAQLHAATANIGVAISAFFPQFNLTGTIGFQSGNFGNLLQWANAGWSAGPSVTWQIFAAGGIVANIHLQEAAQLQAVYNYRLTVLTAFQQVESALIAYSNEQIRREALRRAVVANQKSYDLSNQLYREGSTIFLNVLTAERSLYASQESLAVSEQALSGDLITLFQALGGGWSEFPEADAMPKNFPVFPYAPPPKAYYSPHVK